MCGGKGARTQQTPGRGPLCSGQSWGLHQVMENMTEGAPASHRMSPASSSPVVPVSSGATPGQAAQQFPHCLRPQTVRLLH